MLVLLSLFHQQLLGIRDIVPASFPFRSLLLTRRGGVESNRRRRGPAPRASRRRPPPGRRRRRHHRHALHPLPLFPRATSAKIRAKQRKNDNQQHALSNAFILKETFPPASREIGGGSEPGRRSPRGGDVVLRVRPKIPRRRFRLPRFPIVKICFRFILVRPRRGPGADFALLLLFHCRRGCRRGRLWWTSRTTTTTTQVNLRRRRALLRLHFLRWFFPGIVLVIRSISSLFRRRRSRRFSQVLLQQLLLLGWCA